MEKNNKIMQFIGLDCILMILLTMVDQWTKSLVVHHLKGQSDVILILPAALSGKPGGCFWNSAESACGLCGTDRNLSGSCLLVPAPVSENRTIYSAAYHCIGTDCGSSWELYRPASSGICRRLFLFFTDQFSDI